MIVTVTMNPAIDKTVELKSFVHGGLNRIENITLDAGGKGINVSKTIKELGGNTVATGFLGGNNGKTLHKLLDDFNIFTDFVEIYGETRINTKIVEADGTVTELNEAGPVVCEEKHKELIDKLLQYATEDAWFVLSGSLPAGVSNTIYKEIIAKVHEKGAKVFLDAEGELFAYGLEAKPDIIKPNRIELEKHVGTSEKLDEESMIQIANCFLEQGIGTVIISMGEEGALFLSKNQRMKCRAIPVKAHSTVGAGDAMVAAFTYGMTHGYTFEECVKLSIATSAGAVATVGTKSPKLEEVEALLERVQIEYECQKKDE